MSVRTRTRPTRAGRLPVKSRAPKKRTSWREVAKKEIRRFSEAGLMLRGCRYKKTITQIELAKAVGVSQHHISEIENGKRPVEKEIAQRLAKFFDTSYRIFL